MQPPTDPSPTAHTHEDIDARSPIRPDNGGIGKFLTLSTIWWWVVPVTIFCVSILQPVKPNDFWWHIRTGQIILSTGHIPTIDAFSFTRTGEIWINQSWLMQITLYVLYRIGAGPIDLVGNLANSGGLALVLLAHAIWITIGYSLVLLTVGRRLGIRVAAVATFLGVTLGLSDWAVRPQSVSFLFFGILIYLIEEHRAGQTRKLWWTVPLFALWVNSHGGFIFGVGALGFYVLGQLWIFWRSHMPKSNRRSMFALAANGLLTLVALSLNPQGPIGIINYVLSFFRSDVTIQLNSEFVPLTLRQTNGLLLFGVLLFLVFCLLRTRWRLQPYQVISLLAFLTLALYTQRGLPWLGIIMIPILADGLNHLWTGNKTIHPGKAGLNGAILVIFGLSVLMALPWWRGSLPLPQEKRVLASINTPQAATAFLCRQADTTERPIRVYQHFAFASYQIWACPDLPVFIDTRIEMYDGRIWTDYFAISEGRFDWTSVAKDHGITHLFLDPLEQPQAIRAAQSNICWSQTYQDDVAVIFEHNIGCP